MQTARNGHEALEVARQIRPHVILLDIGLPGMNGYEVASRLRDDAHCKQAALIAAIKPASVPKSPDFINT